MKRLTLIRKFRGLSVETYMHLFKGLVRSRLEYPAFALTRVSKSNISKMQAVQNRALRRAFRDSPPYRSTIKELHEYLELEPLNVRFHRLANKTWDRP